ncbi:MAG TPA: acyltransferase [Caulobacteraceae bacterium]|jgi:peptidoglycan/LPS O-acetylase OafA/YrhL
MPAEHLKSLTSLRFFAAMWVVLFDYWPNLAATGTPRIVERGFLGVEVFFVLSGFILCHVYLPQAEAGRLRYGSFLWARIARVYPLHLATLAGVAVLGLAALALGMSVDENTLAWRALPAHLLMLHAWGFTNVAGWNHPSWSISAEWFAYVTFPAFAWAAIKLRARPRLAAAAATAAMFALYAAFQRIADFPLTEATFAWGALRIVPCFALGCALYLVWRSGAVQSRTTALAGVALSLAGLALAAQLDALDGVVVVAGGLLILFLAAAVRNGSPVGSSPILVYLGEVSYAVYMVAIPWQLVVVNAAAKLPMVGSEKLPPLLWLVFVLSVIPVAAVAHHLVERPARRLLRARAPRFALGAAEARTA